MNEQSNDNVTSTDAQKNNNTTSNNSGCTGCFGVILIVVLILWIIGSCSGSSEDKVYSETCGACGTTWSYEASEYGGTASRNVKCIRMTNLCKSCYNAYCYSIGATPKDY